MGNAKDEDSQNKHFEKKVDALEIEMLNPVGSSSNSNGPSQLSQRIDNFLTLVRLYMEIYPKVTMAVAGVVGLILIKLLFFRHRGQTLYIPPHLKNHYGDVQSYYDLQIGKIDHWCLGGGDDNCRCDDPTEGVSREEANGWMEAFQQNKQVAKDAPTTLDVVFLGDEFTQAWTGTSLMKRMSGGNRIAESFNKNFQRSQGAFVDGLPLGISGDSTANMLYRIQNGEMPKSLNPKVWWLLIGANDLVLGQCSEEAVIVGILRLADEIAMERPGSVVVIQGLLPRSSFSDGMLSHSKKPKATVFHKKRTPSKEYYKPDQYPLWPSIKLINEELERFCEKHEHMIYFDSSSLFFGSVGNEHFESSEKVIVKELMPDYAHPSVQGYELMAKVMGKEVNRIIYDNDEENHVTTGNEKKV